MGGETSRVVADLDEKFRRASITTDREHWSICWVVENQPTFVRIVWLEDGAKKSEGIMRSRITTLQLLR